jgi:uncharacterized protein
MYSGRYLDDTIARPLYCAANFYTANERNAEMSDATQMAIEAAVFRRLLQHLDARKDVQNIDLMNLAGFCRNCLAKWYVAGAAENGVEIDYEAARERIYGMPYSEWKDRYQQVASPEKLAEFNRTNGSE